METITSQVRRLTSSWMMGHARLFNRRHWTPRALAIVFLAALTATWIGSAVSMLAHSNAYPETSSWKKFPARFESFLNEHLVARTTLLDCNARLKVDVFGVSSTARVWIGSDGMLFYNHRAAMPAELVGEGAEAKCIEHWGRLVRARRDWCASRNYQFLTLVVPDKQTVYAERLRPVIRNRQSDGVLDRLFAQWNDAPAVTTIDLRGELIAGKSTQAVYRLGDTHWTPYGCWLGYCCTIGALNRAAHSWSDLPISTERFSGGDVWQLLGLTRPPPLEEYPCPHLHNSPAKCTIEPVGIAERDRLSHLSSVVWTNASCFGPRVVLFCDSFADDLFQQFLAQHCVRLVVVPTYEMIESIIERERPDVVICETVERSILETRPRLPNGP
jgi:alginate O-acetyltransferase complex protein AlgJ